MGALDKMQRGDLNEETLALVMRMFEHSISQRDADKHQIEKLTEVVSNLTEYVKVMDEEQSKRLDHLSTSQHHETPSSLPLDAETKNRIAEIEKTLSVVAQQLSSSELVKLPDGSSVTRSELASYAMMQRINEQLKTTASASGDLAEAVRSRGNVRIDASKLAEHAVKVLDARLGKAVEAPIHRVEETVAGLEERVSNIGMEKFSEVVSAADDVGRAVGRAERRVEQLSSKVTWTAVGRMSLALLPFAAVFIVLGGLIGGITQAVGFGPLLGWAWDSFAAATAWWSKGLIALGTLTCVGLFVGLIWWLGHKLFDTYRYW